MTPSPTLRDMLRDALQQHCTIVTMAAGREDDVIEMLVSVFSQWVEVQVKTMVGKEQ